MHYVERVVMLDMRAHVHGLTHACGLRVTACEKWETGAERTILDTFWNFLDRNLNYILLLYFMQTYAHSLIIEFNWLISQGIHEN